MNNFEQLKQRNSKFASDDLATVTVGELNSLIRRAQFADKLQAREVRHLSLLDDAQFMLNYWSAHDAPPIEDVAGLLSRLGNASAGSTIKIDAITQEADQKTYSLDCPQCKHPRLMVEKKSTRVNGGSAWLSDGDCVPGVHYSLIAAGLEVPWIDSPDNRVGELCHHYYAVEVGDCPACGCEYFTLRASFLDDRVHLTSESNFVETYFFENYEHPEPTNFFAFFNDLPSIPPWLMQKHDTPIGVASVHIFGPFAHETTLRGQYGVSACGDGDHDVWSWSHDFLLEHWTSFKGFARKINQHPKLDQVIANANPPRI